jgi:hypothetical protein
VRGEERSGKECRGSKIRVRVPTLLQTLMSANWEPTLVFKIQRVQIPLEVIFVIAMITFMEMDLFCAYVNILIVGNFFKIFII